MSGPVQYSVEDDIALIQTDNPPVNALGQMVRAGLLENLQTALTDSSAKAVVICCSGRTFFAGADIREFGKPPLAPSLVDVLNAIEASTKPVIAAMFGTSLGGGLETALACHYRVAVVGSQVGLPEVNLGLLPGAGGTVRLPRLIGVQKAIEIMTGGKPLSVTKACELGFVDQLVEASDDADADTARAAAVAFARHVIDDNLALRPTRALASGLQQVCENPAVLDEIRAAVRAKARGALAPEACVDAVAAAVTLPFDEAQAEARRLFTDLLQGDQSRALRHVFMAERAVAKVPEIVDATVSQIKSCAVIGGGTMGAGITVALLNAGLPVHMIERDGESLQRGRENVLRILQSAVTRGRMTEQAMHETLAANYSVSMDYADVATVDLVIEAVFEDMRIKHEVFTNLEQHCKKGAILASNTSYLDINAIASATSRTDHVVGLHFFSPAHVMKLLEVVVAEKTDRNVAASCFALAKKIGKVGVRAGVCDGFIGNRILSRYKLCAEYIMEDGASPYEIDAAIKSFGYPMGIFAMGDLAGLDIGWATRKRKAPQRDPLERYVTVADTICEQGWYGQKTGSGFYSYSAGSRSAVERPEVLDIVAHARAQKGITAREFDEAQIVERYMAAMVNEAANVVHEGIALRPLDVDITAIYGYGFPRWRGGPMQYADTIGLDTMLASIHRFSTEDAYFWQPSPLLEELVERGDNFASLN